MSYQPIENYGIIGDLHTVALVGMNGSIDWLCFPSFDSPSVFAAILDDKKGGRFQISPKSGTVTYKQFYWPDTNVLVTRFLSPDGVAEIVDFMPVAEPGPWEGEHHLIRRVSVVRGSMAFRLECRPAFDYARDSHVIRACPEGVTFHSPKLSLGLASQIPLWQDGEGGTAAEFTLGEGDTAIFLLQQISPGSGCGKALTESKASALFDSTVRYWRRWVANCVYRGRWRETVCRSALVLKLLTYEPTGAIVAAPTCSLPEKVGVGRGRKGYAGESMATGKFLKTLARFKSFLRPNDEICILSPVKILSQRLGAR